MHHSDKSAAERRVQEAEAAEARYYRDDQDAIEPGGCPICAPMACDDPDQHLGVDPKYTPLKNRGCICGADFDGRDCMCFEGGD